MSLLSTIIFVVIRNAYLSHICTHNYLIISTVRGKFSETHIWIYNYFQENRIKFSQPNYASTMTYPPPPWNFIGCIHLLSHYLLTIKRLAKRQAEYFWFAKRAYNKGDSFVIWKEQNLISWEHLHCFFQRYTKIKFI